MTDSIPRVRMCVVCAGNICRSPIAEVVLRHHLARAGLDEHVAVESAGTGDWHAGQRADPRTIAALRRHGYDGTTHRARQFRAEWFAAVDLVLAMDRQNLADLHRLAVDDDARAKIQMLRSYDAGALADGEFDVPDPYLSDDESFERVIAMIEQAAPGLVATIKQELALDGVADDDGRPTADQPEGGEHGRH